jgi:hypothetical protein
MKRKQQSEMDNCNNCYIAFMIRLIKILPIMNNLLSYTKHQNIMLILIQFFRDRTDIK